MKTDHSIFSRRELRTVAGLVALYAAVAVGSQVLTPAEDSSSAGVRLRPAITGSEAAGAVEAVPLPSPAGDTVTTG